MTPQTQGPGAPTHGDTVTIRLLVAELLEVREWTPYRLAKEADLPMPVAYRLAKPGGDFKRLDLETLDKLCRVFGVQPGDLLQYVPAKPAKGPKRGRG